jgi:hypothetical protein
MVLIAHGIMNRNMTLARAKRMVAALMGPLEDMGLQNLLGLAINIERASTIEEAQEAIRGYRWPSSKNSFTG